MQRRVSALIGAAVLALTAGWMPAASAVQVAPAPDPGFVIIDPSDGVSTSDGTFYPTGPLDDDTLIVIANEDGTLPGGLSEAALTRLVNQGPAAVDAVSNFGVEAAGMAVTASHSYTAAFNVWSSAYTGASIWGYDSTARVTYSFSVTPSTNQQAAGQGLGYYKGYNGSELGVWSKWYGLGIASDGSNGGGTVPWGKVIATAKFKAMSTVLHLAIGYFTP